MDTAAAMLTAPAGVDADAWEGLVRLGETEAAARLHEMIRTDVRMALVVDLRQLDPDAVEEFTAVLAADAVRALYSARQAASLLKEQRCAVDKLVKQQEQPQQPAAGAR